MSGYDFIHQKTRNYSCFNAWNRKCFTPSSKVITENDNVPVASIRRWERPQYINGYPIKSIFTNFSPMFNIFVHSFPPIPLLNLIERLMDPKMRTRNMVMHVRQNSKLLTLVEQRAEKTNPKNCAFDCRLNDKVIHHAQYKNYHS